MKRNNSPGVLLLTFVSLAALGTSCASSPKGYISILDQEGEFASLPPGASTYLYIDVAGARSILEGLSFKGMSGSQFSEFFDMTTSAVMAFYPETAPRSFLAATRGTYPSFKANTSFTFSSSWKKRYSQTGDPYWHSPKEGFSISLSSKRAFISDGDPFILSPRAAVPGDFASFREGAVLAGWLENSAARINQFLETLGIPIQVPAGQVLFGIHKSETQYQGMIRLETPSVSQAKALAALFAMARLFMPNQSAVSSDAPDPLLIMGVLFANPPLQDGPYLNLRTGLLDEKGITLLFKLFSVYSN